MSPDTYDSLELSRQSAAPIELYRFQMGSEVWRYTSADQPIVFRDFRYDPETLTREAAKYDQEISSGSLVLSVPRVNPVAALFIPGTPAQPVTLTLYRFHRTAPGDVVAFPPSAVVSCEFEEAIAKLTCATVSQLLQREIPTIVLQRQCNWALYGPGCRVSPANFTDAATVSAVAGVSVILELPTPRPSGWYDRGFLQTESGRRAFIQAQAGDQFTLRFPLPGLEVGDPVTVTAGCDHLNTTCDQKFDNVLRFMGWPEMPTRNPFTAGF